MFDYTKADALTSAGEEGFSMEAIASPNPLAVLTQPSLGSRNQSLPIETLEATSVLLNSQPLFTNDELLVELVENPVNASITDLARTVNESADSGEDSLLRGGLLARLEANSPASDLDSEASDPMLGSFVAGDNGQVNVDFLFDGGGFEGELAVFSLEGMNDLSPEAFAQEAIRRAASNTAEGQVVIDDKAEGAQFSGFLGERDANQGQSAGTKTLALAANSRFAFLAVPNSSIDQALAGAQQPFFSIAALNPGGQTQIAQAAEGVFAMEDLPIGKGDSDFNDFIFGVSGAESNITDLQRVINPEKDWRTSEIAQSFLRNPTFSKADSPAPEIPSVDGPIDSPVEDSPAQQPIDTPVEMPTADSAQPEQTPAQNPTNSPAENPAENPTEEPAAEPTAEDPPSEKPIPEKPAEAPVEVPSEILTSSSAAISNISTNVAKFNGNSTEADIIASGANKVVLGTQTIYIGTEQVTSINQNPILRSFDPVNPNNNWTRRDLETSGTDGRGLGLLWSGSALYGVFSVDGTQNDGQDFRRAAGNAEQNWLKSYGPGGGGKIAVLAQLDPQTGALLEAAHLSAITSNGKTNSLFVTDASANSAGNLVVQAKSFFSPRQPNGSAKIRNPGTTGDSPFDYTIEITADLSEVVSTSAPGWT